MNLRPAFTLIARKTDSANCRYDIRKEKAPPRLSHTGEYRGGTLFFNQEYRYLLMLCLGVFSKGSLRNSVQEILL